MPTCTHLVCTCVAAYSLHQLAEQKCCRPALATRCHVPASCIPQLPQVPSFPHASPRQLSSAPAILPHLPAAQQLCSGSPTHSSVFQRHHHRWRVCPQTQTLAVPANLRCALGTGGSLLAQTQLNSAPSERVRRAAFLASFSLSLVVLLRRLDLRPLTTLT